MSAPTRHSVQSHSSAAIRASDCRRSPGGRVSRISRRRTPSRRSVGWVASADRIWLLWIKARLRRAARPCACGLQPFTAAPALGCLSVAPRALPPAGASRLRDDGPHLAGYLGVGSGDASSRLPLRAQSGPIRSRRRGQGRSSSGALHHLVPPASPDRAMRGLSGRREDARGRACCA
jgi:hypothetical protein